MCGDWVGTVVFLFDSTGSGCVSAFVSQILGTSAAYICTDINARATECTIETGARNKVSLQPVLTSSVEALRPRVDGAVDLLIFNPPYVVTTEEEEEAGQVRAGLDGAWAGGASGTKILDTLIQNHTIPQLLRRGGRFYVVAIRQNDPPSLVRAMQSIGLEASIVLLRRANREQLFIIRAIRP